MVSRSLIKSQVILLIETGLPDVDKYIQEYFCSLSNDELYKTKIKQQKYQDLITIHGDTHMIDKQSITNLIEQFSYGAIEKWGIKLFIIHHIENGNKQALNSLLKFLEEPPTNTFGILTTTSLPKVLPTIVSRCSVQILPTDNDALNKLFLENNISNEIQFVAKQTYSSYKSLLIDIKNNKLIENYNFASWFIRPKKTIQEIKTKSDAFFILPYSEIKKILSMIFILSRNEKVLLLLDTLHVNPIKHLLFNNLLTIIR